jgi:hypothetical protein
MDYPEAHTAYTRYLYNRKVDGVVAISQKISALLIEAGVERERIRLIYTGIDPLPFEAAARSREAQTERIVIGMAAVLEERKGHRFLFEAARRGIEQTLGAPVYNTYGSREFMSIAGECEYRQGLHINAENLVVETRDPDSKEPSEILVTDLHNYGMPFVRYATGDVGTISDISCACGRGLPLLGSIEGRLLDSIRTIDGRTVPGEFFPHLLKEVPEFAEYRVEQRTLDHVVISAVLTEALSERSERLLSYEIEKVFGSATRWEVQPVNEIPNLRSGKRRVTVGLGA